MTQLETRRTGGQPPTRRRFSPRRRRRLVRTMLVLLAVTITPVCVSIGRAVNAPGTDSVSARLAEWARDHGLGGAVTALERAAYRPPKVGGAPPSTSPLRQGDLPAGAAHQASTALPRPIKPLASPALTGEGRWHVLDSSRGRPAVAAAYLRPDALHTSYVTGVVWFDPRLVRAELHPGALDPGGSGWAEPKDLPAARRSGLLAAFNSGFRLNASRGGFYEAGRYAAPLRAGAASMVFRRDGTLTVGQWGRDVRLGPDVEAVRQNLALLVDDGRVVPGVDSNAGQAWGATLGNASYVWRSGIGVRQTGA